MSLSPEAAGGRPAAAYPAYPESRPAVVSPPLTKRMRASHWIAIDCVIGAILALLDTAIATPSFPTMGTARFLFALLFLVLVFLPVALRRRAPVIAFGGLLVLGVLLAGLSTMATAGIFLAAAFTLYTVTVESRRRTGLAALGLMIAVTAFLVGAGPHGPNRPSPQPTSGILVPIALVNVMAWMTGYSVRQRRRYIVTLQQQAASSAVAEERLRIARELHDVVAHSMSVIAVQAGYGQYVIDASPSGAKDALGAIQATSRDALEEMRRMLGVLRQQDMTPGSAGNSVGNPAGLPPLLGTAPARDVSIQAETAAQSAQAPLAPAPGLASLDRLIERTRGAGLQVTLDVAGHARTVPPGTDLAAYRIIQEALTNVVRHAGTAAACVVSVAYTDSDLVIRVTDDGGTPTALHPASPSALAGGGHGIIGMRERVHLCGGSFSAMPRPEGGFCVMAALPLPAFDSLTKQPQPKQSQPTQPATGASLGDFPPFDQLSGARR
jgi:signal transduction histidine kinase